MDELEKKIREISLPERIDMAIKMISAMCAEVRHPKMSVSVQATDEDVFITTTLMDAGTHIAELTTALDEGLKLQRNYATLLNMYDGGERMVFDSADAWIERLREIGKLTAA